MKIRSVILIVLLVGAFVYLTSYSNFRGANNLPLAKVWRESPLQLTVADAQPAYTAEETNRIAVYKRTLPSVVNVTSSALAFDFFYGVVPQSGQGSGFILSKDGRILTNYHVIENAQKVEVTLSDKHKYSAQVVLQDKAHDLALLQINAPNLTPAVLSESRDLQVGQNVYAIGNPFGLNGTMTTGIISSIRSVREPQGATIENALQTDAAINPGNSGGPLLNSRGEVIGMNTLIATGGAEQSSGIGFAIPVDTIKAVLSDYTKYGRVRRPSLGIASLADRARSRGADWIAGRLRRAGTEGHSREEQPSVLDCGAAISKSYLGNTPIYLGGDLIVAIDEDRVTSPQDISEIMDHHQAGDTVTVTFFRGQRQMTAKLTLGEAHSVSV